MEKLILRSGNWLFWNKRNSLLRWNMDDDDDDDDEDDDDDDDDDDKESKH